MPSRYHPIEDGLWNDEKFDAHVDLPRASFEERAFFCFLASNHRQRPSGIYRVSDEQLASDTLLPVRRVKAFLSALERRHLIVRDGDWIFLPGYFKRQPKQDRLLSAVHVNISSCSSERILRSFAELYPLLNRWSRDRLETVTRPINHFVPPEQSRAEQSNNRKREGGDCSERAASLHTGSAPGEVDQTEGGEASEPRKEEETCTEKANGLDRALKAILDECPHLSLVSTPASSGFWDQVLGACEPYPTADGAWLGAKLRQWNQYFAARPHKRSRERKYLESRLMGWLTKDLEELARRSR